MAGSTSLAALADGPAVEHDAAIMVIDRRALVRLGLCRLAREALAAPVLSAATPLEAGEGLEPVAAPAALTLLGLAAGDADGPAALVSQVRTLIGGPVVAAVFAGDVALLAPALRSGAHGGLVLDTAEPQTLRSLAATIEAGTRFLSPELAGWSDRSAGLALSDRCVEVLAALAAGLRDDEVAAALGMSSSCVRKHVRTAEARLHARTRTEAIARAVRCGLL